MDFIQILKDAVSVFHLFAATTKAEIQAIITEIENARWL
jgi:hypothetical protein